MGKIEPFASRFIVGILITLFSITGCSDMPYTGSGLTANEVDRYLVSTDGNVVCFQDGNDETCLKLIPETQNGAPTIHIYPEKQIYLFYHEGNPILRAARVGDNNGNNGDGNNGNGHWVLPRRWCRFVFTFAWPGGPAIAWLHNLAA